MTFQDLLDQARAARSDPGPEQIADAVADLWTRVASLSEEDPGKDRLFRATVLASAAMDRPWLCGAVAIQAAVHSLLSRTAPEAADFCGIAAFCASEAGGNHPRAIESQLRPHSTGSGFELNGTKRWSTLAPLADRLLILASAGRSEDRNDLRALLVPTERAGIFVEEMTIPGSVQASLRLPHGLVYLESVKVAADEVLPGDGYTDYLKPYRTVEDLLVTAARCSSLLSLGFRTEASAATMERLVGILGTLHLAVGEEIGSPAAALLVGAAEKTLAQVVPVMFDDLPAEVASWWRDESGIEVARSAKDVRRGRALERLGGEG